MSKHSTEQIQYVANSIMSNFIPKDENAKDLTFAFTLDGTNYEVVYQKDNNGIWLYKSHQKA